MNLAGAQTTTWIVHLSPTRGARLHGIRNPFELPALLQEFSGAREDSGTRETDELFSILANQMGDKAFLVSDEMTIADCYLFWVLMVAPKSGIELPERLRKAFDRLKARPSVDRALSEEGLS